MMIIFKKCNKRYLTSQSINKNYTYDSDKFYRKLIKKIQLNLRIIFKFIPLIQEN